MTIPALNPEGGYRRLRIDIAYDGTRYAGWAIQPDFPTVQAEVEAALSRIARTHIGTVVAGRTDAGVHASGQVIHADIPPKPKFNRYHPLQREWDLPNFHYRLNQILPEDIRILKLDFAPENFHARFGASARHYQYRIADNNVIVPPMKRLNVATWYRPLDPDLMNEASAQLLGEHDFAAFCKFRRAATTIRTLTQFEWSRDEDGYLIADLAADAFCYNMVRNLVGAAVCVGESRFPVEWIVKVLAGKARVSDSYVFPPRGLTLTRVDFPPTGQLATQVVRAMARRGEEG